MEEKLLEIQEDIRSLRDSDNHLCPCHENPDDTDVCTCNTYDVVIDKIDKVSNLMSEENEDLESGLETAIEVLDLVRDEPSIIGDDFIQKTINILRQSLNQNVNRTMLYDVPPIFLREPTVGQLVRNATRRFDSKSSRILFIWGGKWVLNEIRYRKRNRKIDLHQVIKDLNQSLTEDAEYRNGWIANIAMSFKDSYALYKKRNSKKVLNTNDIHAVSNQAADRFLQILNSQQNGKK